MKEVDDTPVTESISEDEMIAYTTRKITYLEARVVELEKEVALLLEQRETVRAPEATDDPEWF
jgi:hypothetical protein|tara:strand:+ start:415 stop:603 length:189 start_codon:yes stop_codon:yes gene_type:complete